MQAFAQEIHRIALSTKSSHDCNIKPDRRDITRAEDLIHHYTQKCKASKKMYAVDIKTHVSLRSWEGQIIPGGYARNHVAVRHVYGFNTPSTKY